MACITVLYLDLLAIEHHRTMSFETVAFRLGYNTPRFATDMGPSKVR